jgi:hypothetical protein
VFRGLVCYYGLHYISIFQESVQEENTVRFLLFDDHNIRVLGNWESVKLECFKAHYQPVLLLYEIENILPNRYSSQRTLEKTKVPYNNLDQKQSPSNNRAAYSPEIIGNINLIESSNLGVAMLKQQEKIYELATNRRLSINQKTDLNKSEFKNFEGKKSDEIDEKDYEIISNPKHLINTSFGRSMNDIGPEEMLLNVRARLVGTGK